MNADGRTRWIKDPGSLALGALVIAGLVAGWLYPSSVALQEYAPPCVFRSLFDVPCPTCGTTRVFVLLAHFDVVHALWFAPLPTLLIALGGIFGAWAFLRQVGLVQPSADLFLADLLSQKRSGFVLVAIVALAWGVSLLRMRAGLAL